MKKNIIIITVLVILLVVSAVLFLNRDSGTFKKKDKDFAVQDTASITKIFLADKKNRTVLLERMQDGTWQLNNSFLARKSGVDLMLETMKNLVAKYPVSKSAHNNIVAQMASSSIKVEVYQEVYRINLFDWIQLFKHEKLTKTYYVGGATPDNMGTFMLMEGSDIPFVIQLLGLRGYVATRYSPIEKDWLDHTIFKTKLYDIQSVEMEIPGDPENSYKIINKNDEIELYKLSTNQKMPGFDTLKVLNYLTSFADLKYETFLDEINPRRQDSIVNSVPAHIITLVDNYGDTTAIKTFLKPNDEDVVDIDGNFMISDVDRLYALINDEQDFVLIQYFVFDKILRPLSFFRPE